MVKECLDGVVLKTVRDTKKLCRNIKETCEKIKNTTYKMMAELKDLSLKQDYLITNLRDEYYRLGQEQYAGYEREYLKRD